MMKSFSKIFILLILCGMTGGCFSFRFLTTVEKQKIKTGYPIRFRIAQLEYPELPQQLPYKPSRAPGLVEGYCFTADGSGGLTGVTTGWLSKVINEKAIIRYPALFSADGDAVPVRVKITRTGKSTVDKAVFSQILVLGLLPTFFTEYGKFDVAVSIDEPESRRIADCTFERVNKGWVSLITPWAAFDVPGETHAKKVSGAMASLRAIPISGDLTLDSIVDSIAQILQKRDLTPEIEEYIKSQRKF